MEIPEPELEEPVVEKRARTERSKTEIYTEDGGEAEASKFQSRLKKGHTTTCQ